MPNIKVLKDPGFLYDLNYVFYAKFNTQRCVDMIDNDKRKDAYENYLKETLTLFGDISDDLYVFYHALKNGNCFMTTYCINPYKDKFATDFNFKYFKSLLLDTDGLTKNLIRFYLNELSDEQLEECFASITKLFAYIKESKYSDEEKSKLYEFFIDPAPYFQTLQCELIEKEILLSNYYKENYDKIIEAHNKTTFGSDYENLKKLEDFTFLDDGSQVLYISYCLLHKYFMQIFFVSSGAIYLLGHDYLEILDEAIKNNPNHPLQDLCYALGEESRVQILDLLLTRSEVTCKDLERIFNFSGSTAYHHLTLLVRVGAVKIRTEGKTIYYSLNRKYFDMMSTMMKKYTSH